MARFEMRIDDELLERVDRARGDTPRAAWFKRLAERELAHLDAAIAGIPVLEAALHAPDADRARAFVEQALALFREPFAPKPEPVTPQVEDESMNQKTVKVIIVGEPQQPDPPDEAPSPLAAPLKPFIACHPRHTVVRNDDGSRSCTSCGAFLPVGKFMWEQAE